MRTRKHKPHIAHILTLGLVWLILPLSGDMALSAWQPPIGNEEDSNNNSGQEQQKTKFINIF